MVSSLWLSLSSAAVRIVGPSTEAAIELEQSPEFAGAADSRRFQTSTEFAVRRVIGRVDYDRVRNPQEVLFRICRKHSGPGYRSSQVPEEQLQPMTKRGLTPPELKVYKDQLLQLRSRLRGEVSTMAEHALRDAKGESSAVPLHMADIGSDNFEQEFTLSLMANEGDTLNMIEAALERIEEGSYGICEECVQLQQMELATVTSQQVNI